MGFKKSILEADSPSLLNQPYILQQVIIFVYCKALEVSCLTFCGQALPCYFTVKK